MKSILMAASVLAIASPAFAQTTTTAKPPAANDPMTSAPASTPAADPMATPPADTATTTPAAAPQDPKTIIASEFPTYDKDGNGSLSRAEFDAWMVALKEKSGQPMKPADQTAWLKSSFTTADSNKDKSVSLTELTGYLTAKG